MVGSINAIWLTTNGGSLHPQIIPNLSMLIAEARVLDFAVILWTNTAQIQPSDIEALTVQGIQVKDHSECSTSMFYDCFISFFQKGIDGDRAAFALASDILRMAALELTPNDQYYIYHDANDITFPNFMDSIRSLDKFMASNSFGFSFSIKQISHNKERVYLTRNDLLIAKKSLNAQFFKDYFIYYKNHLEKNIPKYQKPTSNEQARQLAELISNQSNGNFFKFYPFQKMDIIKATFGDNYKTFFPLINSEVFFRYDGQIEHSGNWLIDREPHTLYAMISSELDRVTQPLPSPADSQARFFGNFKLIPLVSKYKLKGTSQEELEKCLRRAAAMGDIKDLSLLIQHGVNVNAKDKTPGSGKTALDWAKEKNQRACEDLLLKSGAATSKQDETPILRRL